MLPFLFAAANCKPTFLGLIPWYQYLNLDSNCEVKSFTIFPQGGHSDVLLVLAAVVDDLLRIAGIVAVIFVIYGAIKYIASQGNSEDASKAQSTIINALVGMAIAMIGVPLVNYIGTQLGQ